MKPATDDDDTFHFVSYIPFEGALYELDGLQSGPIRLGEATNSNWLQKVRPIIQARMAAYQKEGKGEIRFNLLALIKNLQERYSDDIDMELGRKMDYEARLADGETMDVDGDSDLKAKIMQC